MSCRSCKGDVLELKEKWVSILYLMKNTNCQKDQSIFKRCQHLPLTKAETREKAQLKGNSKACNAVVPIARGKSFLKDLHYFKKIEHTGNVEVFYLLRNKYYPKRLYFSFYGTIMRTQLAFLGNNAGAEIELQKAESKDKKNVLSNCFLK